MKRPEILSAQKYIKIYKISPPVDILFEVKKFAEVVFLDDFPVDDVDALLIKSNGSLQYNLLINSKIQHEPRLRFTLAHELGHMMMLWHKGTFACVTNGMNTSFMPDFVSESIEAEANRFAAEILVPTEWAKNVAKSCGYNVEATFSRIKRECEVSNHAAFLSLVKAFPTGYLLILVDESTGKIIYCVKSEDTKINFPIVKRETNKYGIVIFNNNISFHDLDGEIEGYQKEGSFLVSSNKYKIYWWFYSFKEDFDLNFEKENSKDILRQILDELFGKDATNERLHIGQSINGVVATVNSHKTFQTAAELYSLIKQNLHKRYVGEEKFLRVVSHENFEKYLKNKAFEMFSRKNNKKA